MRTPVAPSRSRRTSAFGLLLAVWTAAVAHAQGDLTVTPTRVLFEGRTRSVQLSLIHRGERPATYRLSFVHMRMGEDGELVEVGEPEPEDRFADSLLRYAPRQVRLEPGAAQTVRLLLRKPADLSPGEYRSHLLLRAVPEEGETNVESLTADEDALAIHLTPIYGVAIPVIVRHGELDASFSISDLRFLEGDGESPPQVELRIDRQGGRSIYGDVTVTHHPAGPGTPTVLSLIKGLAVYTPNVGRTLRLELHVPDAVTLQSGRLEVTFSERGDGETALTTAELSLS